MYPLDADFAGAVEAASACLHDGGVLLYPTETVYGLGADPAHEAALRRIHRIKGRDAGKPILVLTDTWARVADWMAARTPLHERLMAADLPLTLLFEATAQVPALLRGNSPYIGIRRTRHPFCRAVIEATACPLCSTSANRAGAPPPVHFDEVARDLLDAVDCAIDAGTPLQGTPSTVVAVENGRVKVLRPGAVSTAALQEIVKA